MNAAERAAELGAEHAQPLPHECDDWADGECLYCLGWAERESTIRQTVQTD